MEMEAPVQIKNRQQLLIILALTAVALYAGNFLVYEPMSKWWKDRSDRVTQLRQEVTQGKALIRREAVIRGEWDNMRTNSLASNPSQAEQQLLKAFNNWAGDSGVNVNGITPQWQDDQDDYSTLDCRIETTGDLQTLSRFLYEIESDPMALQLQTITLSSTDERGQQLTLGLQLSGLALISQQP
jgi:Tfp pilus assembly protein PilO